MSVITKEVSFDCTRIRFDGVTHLLFIHEQVLGFQTWKFSGVYTIEITFKFGSVLITEYDQKWKWEQVIVLVEGSLATWGDAARKEKDAG